MAEGSVFGDSTEANPVSVDLNVDAALALQRLAGIDAYPHVLAIMPNVYGIEDAELVHKVVVEQLTVAGLVEAGEPHPAIERWLHCLDRPDVELALRIVDNGTGDHDSAMLRMAFVRRGTEHVLAVRCDDEVVIQPVFTTDKGLDPLVAAVKSAVGSYPTLDIEPFSADPASLADVPVEPQERRTALRELGASPRTASALTRALDEVVRRAELVMVEHRDGAPDSAEPVASASVLDTLSGRLVVTPGAALDGRIWSNFQRGDDAALASGLDALVELLPSRSWFDTARTG